MPKGQRTIPFPFPPFMGSSLWKSSATALIYVETYAGFTYTYAIDGTTHTIISSQLVGTADAVVFNATFVYVNALGGGSVFCDEADYNILDPLNVPQDFMLYGAGMNTVLQYNAGGNCITITGDNVIICNLRITITAGAGGVGTRPNCIFADTRTNIEISSVWLIGDLTVADDGSTIRQCGIVFNTVTYSKVSLCNIDNPRRSSISLTASTDNTLSENICLGALAETFILANASSDNLLTGNTLTGFQEGIYLDASLSNIIAENICHDCGTMGIHVAQASHNNTIVGNNCQRSGTLHGIFIADSDNNTITGNTCIDNRIDGIDLTSSDNNTVTGNTCYSNGNGMTIAGASNNTITGNTFSENTRFGFYSTGSDDNAIVGNFCLTNSQYGINMLFSDRNLIVGNVCRRNYRTGIQMDNSSYNHVVSNYCNENDYANTGTYDGITIEDDSDENVVMCNTCNDNDRWGISIGLAVNSCVGNWVKNNHLRGNTSGPFADAGTNTQLAVITLEFNKWGGGSAGLTAPVINTSPGGIDLDADNEFAYVDTVLPLELQQVVRIKIWAYSNVIEAANNMLLRLVAHGATSSELWSGNAIDVINEPSLETGGIVVGDVIHWVFTAVDDAQIGTLAAQDYMEIMAVGEAAVAPDVATDALFGGVEIEHV